MIPGPPREARGSAIPDLPEEDHGTLYGRLRIRPATRADLPLLLALIKELAAFEQAGDRVRATESLLEESMFGSPRRAEAVLGFLGDEPAGFAVFYHSFSTYLGRGCLHLEDLFVRPERRKGGIGRVFLGYVARVARSRRCGLMEWSSLHWNEEARRFYRRLGARDEERWMYQLAGEVLERLAEAEAGKE